MHAFMLRSQRCPLGAAGTYAILAKSGISGIIGTVTGDLGVSPAAATYITGFSLTADTSNTYATSVQVTGRVYAASYVSPTPEHLTDRRCRYMELAFTDAAARTLQVTELANGSIRRPTLAPGGYAWDDGSSRSRRTSSSTAAPDEIWILQIAQDLHLSADTTHVVLAAGGALAKNVFWQVSGAVTVAANARSSMAPCSPRRPSRSRWAPPCTGGYSPRPRSMPMVAP